jgi:hypothetical protein
MMAPNNAIMKKVIEAENLFTTCNPSEGQRHTRKRKMVFRTKEISMTADIEDIMNFIMGDNTKFSNRLLTVVEGVCEMCGMDSDSFKANPVKTILELFAFTDYPMFCFRTFLEEFVSHRTNLSVEVMVSSVDRGNIVDNLVALHCEREYPYQLLKPNRTSGLGELKDLFETWIAISRSPLEFPLALVPPVLREDESFFTIRTTDGLMERGLKLVMGRIGGVVPLSTHVFTHSHKENADKFGRSVITVYFDLRDLLVVRYDHDKKEVHHEAMSRERVFDTSGHLMKIYNMDYSMETKGEYKKYYYNKEVVYASFTQSQRTMEDMLSCSFEVATWSLYLKASWKGPLKFYSQEECRFKLFTDRYNITTSVLHQLKAGPNMDMYVDQFTRFRFREMSLLELQSFLKANQLMTDKPIRMIVDRVSENSKMYDNIEMEMEAFCSMESNIHTLPCFNFTADARPLMEIDLEAAMEEDANFDWVTEEMLETLTNDINQEEEWYEMNIDPHERIHMGSMIASAIGDAFDREMIMDEKSILGSFAAVNKVGLVSREINMRWSHLATLIHFADDEFEHWFIRLMLCYVYLKLSRKRKLKKPKDLVLGLEKPSEKVTWISRAKFEEAEKELYMYFEDEYPELMEPAMARLNTNSGSSLGN